MKDGSQVSTLTRMMTCIMAQGQLQLDRTEELTVLIGTAINGRAISGKATNGTRKGGTERKKRISRGGFMTSTTSRMRWRWAVEAETLTSR